MYCREEGEMNFDVVFEKLIGRGWARRIADNLLEA